MPTKSSFLDLTFPVLGIDLSAPFGAQRGGTTPVGVNVRAYEPSTLRARGGSRAGLSKLTASTPSGVHPIQDLAVVVGVGYTAPGGGIEDASSSSGRIVTLVCVVNGDVRVLDAGATSWVTPTSGTAALSTSARVFSASNNQELWYADGTNYKYYKPADNTVHAWTAGAGSLPADSSNKPRLIETWRGRTVLSGITTDAQNFFMSAVNDPTDFDYSPLEPSGTDAVAGNNAPSGFVGDVITGMIPYTDDVLVFLCDHSLWLMSGDPLGGGNLDMISGTIGGAWGRAWCMDPYGNIYFVSNRLGLYTMVPGQQPQRISQAIEQELLDVNSGGSAIRLVWDDRFQGLHVFVTTTSAASADTHFFFEQRTGAWWKDEFANHNHNPQTSCVMDGNLPADRRTLLGSWDGHVRVVDPDATKDDGYKIASEVILGPLMTREMDDVLVKSLQAVLGEESSAVAFEVLAGATAEIALSKDPVLTGTWDGGRNLLNLTRASAHALWVKISSSGPWSMEQIRAEVVGKGKVRRRGQ